MTMQGSELAARIKAAGLTQEQIAQAIGMSRISVNRMLNSDAPVDTRTDLAVRFVLDDLDRQRRSIYPSRDPEVADAIARLRANDDHRAAEVVSWIVERNEQLSDAIRTATEALRSVDRHAS